ncbi:MAG: HTTM domain-containing protein [Acidimicrobiales bacterium]
MNSIWFSPAPARHLAYLRISAGGFALGYLLVRAPHLRSFGSYAPERFEPVGVVGTLLGQPLGQTSVDLILAVTIALGVCFVAGIKFRLLAPLFAFGLLWVTSYRNSFGTVLHTENLFVLHVAILSITAAADALSVDARGRSLPADPKYRWPVPSLVLTTGLTYLLAGIAKLQSAGIDWFSGDPLRNHLAYDNLRKHLLGDYSSPIIGFFIRFDWIWAPIAIFAILIELSAPLAVLSRRISVGLAAALWSFHIGVVALMAIVFPYQVLGLAFLPYFLLGLPARDEDQRPSNFASRFSMKAIAASRKSSVPSNGNMPVN